MRFSLRFQAVTGKYCKVMDMFVFYKYILIRTPSKKVQVFKGKFKSSLSDKDPKIKTQGFRIDLRVLRNGMAF